MYYDDDYDYKYIATLASTKRLSVVNAPWMGDWFVSHSPRNGNENAEGPWSHWVQVALSILQHEFTDTVNPELRAAALAFENTNLYSEHPNQMSREHIKAVLAREEEQS
jgi:hypothetical protein